MANDLRFGTTGSGLTSGQLGQLTWAGYTINGLDANGYLLATASAVPEPATCAALAGLSILGFASYRRRSKSE